MNPTMTQTISTHRTDEPNAAKINEIFSRPVLASALNTADVALAVQEWLEDVQPAAIAHNFVSPMHSPFEKGLELDDLSLRDNSDDEMACRQVRPATNHINPLEANSSAEESNPIILSFVGDVAVPTSLRHQIILRDCLVHWAATCLFNLCGLKRGPSLAGLVAEIAQLHEEMRPNVETFVLSLHMSSVLIRSNIFHINCMQAFSTRNPVRVKLGDPQFYIFAAYAICTFLVLEKKGIRPCKRYAKQMGMNENLFEVVTELIDMACEVLPKEKLEKTLPVGIVTLMRWMARLPSAVKDQVQWIITNWYLQAVLYHHELNHPVVNDFFAMNASILYNAPSIEAMVIEHLSLRRHTRRLTRAVEESPKTCKWAVAILEKYIVQVPLDVEQPIYRMHIDTQMPVIICCFTLLVFKRLWQGKALRQALLTEYGPSLNINTVVTSLYCWAIRGATIMLEDRSQGVVLRRIQNATVEQFERLQRAMLEDLDYRLHSSMMEAQQWLHLQLRWTATLDESLRYPFIVNAFKTAVERGGIPEDPLWEGPGDGSGMNEIEQPSNQIDI